jgi:3-ketosteroid 9alpha-monooxygenase subunit B
MTGAAPAFHRIRVAEVIAETADAHSLVLAIPPQLADAFAYRPGQYLTVRVPDGGTAVARCYSLSSSPDTDTDLKITVKRVRDGQASNWICDHVRPGSTLDLAPPAGSPWSTPTATRTRSSSPPNWPLSTATGSG